MVRWRKKKEKVSFQNGFQPLLVFLTIYQLTQFTQKTRLLKGRKRKTLSKNAFSYFDLFIISFALQAA